MTNALAFNWRRALLRFLLKIQSWALIFPALEVELFEAQRLGYESLKFQMNHDALSPRVRAKPRRVGTCVTADGFTAANRRLSRKRSKDVKKLLDAEERGRPHRSMANSGDDFVSLFTRRGLKAINQDAMVVLENFAARSDAVFCGVFDGHGSHGHLIAKSVQELLPKKLAACWHTMCSASLSSSEQTSERTMEDAYVVATWKECFLRAYKQTDRDLLLNKKIDCVLSGTTAVTFVKQGNHLIIGNVGDSRAVLGMLADDNSLMALQLTVDLKPNLPREAERIRRFKGRVFALNSEPMVKRVWLPHHNVPGLAMARSFGDYCLKKFGVISEPVVTYRCLTKNDLFIILATDGVWDVLTNEKAIEIAASVPERSLAAKAVVDAAVCIWKLRSLNSQIDDCSAVCVFLDGTEDSTYCSVFKGEELTYHGSGQQEEKVNRKRKVLMQSMKACEVESYWSELPRARKQASQPKEAASYVDGSRV